MSLLKKLAGETALYGLSSIVGRFLNYLLVPLYTRQFLPGEYGVVSELFSYTGFIMVLYSYRLESAFFRFGTPEADREKTYSTALWSLIFSSALLLIPTLFFSDGIATWLQYKDHPEYVRWFALIITFDALSELPFARLRVEQRPVRFVTAKLLNIGVNISLNLFWILFCPWAAAHGHSWVHQVWSPTVGVGYIFLATLIASVASFLFLLPQLRLIRLQFDLPHWKQMMKYAGPLVVVGFAGIINEMLDRAILVRLLPGSLAENRAQLGIYSANYKLAMLISLFTQAYRYAAEPFFFKNAHGQDSLRLQANAAKWFTIAGSTAMLGILLYLDFIKNFVGERFHSGLKVVPILLLANLFLGIYYNFSVWYRLKDRTMTGAWISIIGAGITILLNFLWVPYLGYMGAAWATLACYIFMSAATWWTGRELHPVPYPLMRMAFFMGLTLAFYGLSLLFRSFIPDFWTGIAFNTLLMGGFMGLVWREWKGRGE